MMFITNRSKNDACFSNFTASIIQNSIIGSFSVLDDIALRHSVIGSDTAVKGARRSLNIGDNTEIDFS